MGFQLRHGVLSFVPHGYALLDSDEFDTIDASANINPVSTTIAH